MKTLVLILLSFIVVPPVLADEAPYDEEADMACFESMYKGKTVGEELTLEGFEKIWPICLKAAESGAQGSQYLVGMVYLGQDKEKAIYWLKKSASSGHTGAIEQLEKIGKH